MLVYIKSVHYILDTVKHVVSLVAETAVTEVTMVRGMVIYKLMTSLTLSDDHYNGPNRSIDPTYSQKNKGPINT